MLPIGYLGGARSFSILTRADQYSDGEESLVGVSTREKQREFIVDRGYRKFF